MNAGTIEGDWKADTIRFDAEPASELAPDAPDAMRTLLTSAGSFQVERAPSSDVAGWRWDPSMQRVFRELDGTNLAIAMLCFCFGLTFVTLRWTRLLRLAGCPSTFFNSLRLSFLGLFFNQVMPGLTGGDLIKGVLAAKENPGRRADAAVSVIVDRLFGLVALAGLSTIVVLFSGEAYRPLQLPLLVFLGLGAAAVSVYASGTLRRVFRLKELISKLPLAGTIQSIDRAALLYLRHPGELVAAFGFSISNHLVVVLGCVFLGHAIGVPSEAVAWSDYYVIVPVANIVSSLPLAPGGWGVGEYAYKLLFEMRGASGALGVALSLVFRLSQLVFGLVGGLYLLVPGARAELAEIEEQPAT